MHELWLNINSLTTLPDDLFDGLTGLRELYLQANPGSPFTFTAALEQTEPTQLQVRVAQAAPFDITVTLAVHGGTLSAGSVVVPAGSAVSPAITLTPTGDDPATVSVSTASFVADVSITHQGIQTGVGAANQAPTPDAGADQTVDTGTTATLDASGSSDPDSTDALRYHWAQTAGATVALSSATAADPTFTAPSSAATLSFTVTVLDGRGGSDRGTVDITVDANDAPTFTSDPRFSLPENTTSVGTVIATDPDANDSVTGHSLSGTDAALFSITSGGVLTFQSAPDFEGPQGGAGDNSNSYTLTVTATSSTLTRILTATQDLTITVTDANEAPTFSSDTTFSPAENTLTVGTVTATDPDAADSVTDYSLSGDDAALFEITSDGDLSFTAAPNFEAPLGGMGDDSNSYEVTITATGGTNDQALTTTQDLTITVTDANEAPTFSSDTTFSPAENTLTVGTVTATDPDAADSVTDYSLSGDDAALFEITSDGDLSFTTAPNFEAPLGGMGDDSNSYEVTITATGGANDQALTTTQDLTITVTNVDEPPVFGAASYAFSVAENVGIPTTIGTVTATDPEGGDVIIFDITGGNEAGIFAVDTLAGSVVVGITLDYETADPYTLTVQATDGQRLTATVSVAITVTDVNEPPQAPAAPTSGTATTTSLAVNWTAPDNTGPAIADYDVQYRKSGVTAWTSLPHTGTALTATISGLEVATTYEVQVRAENDEGESGWSDTLTTATDAPPWTARTFQGTTGYWVRLSWTATKTTGAHGPHGGQTVLQDGTSSVFRKRELRGNKDESGSFSRYGQSPISGYATSLGGMATTQALFVGGSAPFDRYGFAQVYSGAGNLAADNASLRVDYWDGSAWRSVSDLTDGTTNSHGVSFGVEATAGSLPNGWVTWTKPPSDGLSTPAPTAPTVTVRFGSFDDDANTLSVHAGVDDNGGSAVLEFEVRYEGRGGEPGDQHNREGSSGTVKLSAPNGSHRFTNVNDDDVTYWHIWARARNSVGWGPRVYIDPSR